MIKKNYLDWAKEIFLITNWKTIKIIRIHAMLVIIDMKIMMNLIFRVIFCKVIILNKWALLLIKNKNNLKKGLWWNKGRNKRVLN